MQKVFKYWVIFSSVLEFSCETSLKEIYVLNEGQEIITRIDSTDNKTYLFRGDYPQKGFPPKNYLVAENKKFLAGFQAILIYKDHKVVLQQPYDYFNSIGLNEGFIIERVKEEEFFHIFFDENQKDIIRIENK